MAFVASIHSPTECEYTIAEVVDTTAKESEVPNLLTLSRLVLSPYIGYLIVQEQFTVALYGLAAAGISDFLDGYIARNFRQKTFLGSALDPAADKILMTSLTISLCQADLLPREGVTLDSLQEHFTTDTYLYRLP
ncbi:hypothetical protein HDU76_001652 [Blyttiomyces sp. JEL0837]|nr:hypothetical protein HDU76_001652 [Blyttiomyces sp. JEL0837]